MTKTQTKSGREIDWDRASIVATRLAKVCDEVGFVPPEAHQIPLNHAAALMTEIAEALCLLNPPPVIAALVASDSPTPMRLPCPDCGELHIDEGVFATKPHHTHSCQHCGLTWRPAVVATVGVRFLPGFKNEERSDG